MANATYQLNGEPLAPAVQYQEHYSQPTSTSPLAANTGPGNPPDGTAVNSPAAGGDYSQQQSTPSLPTLQSTTSSGASQASPLPPAQGGALLAAPFPAAAQHATLQAQQTGQQYLHQVSVNPAQTQQPTTSQAPAQSYPQQRQTPQVTGAPYATPGSFETQPQPLASNQYTYVGQAPTAQQVQGFPPPVLPLAQPTTHVQVQGSLQADNVLYQYAQAPPGQAAYLQTPAQQQYIPAPSTGPVTPQLHTPFFETRPALAVAGQSLRASKIWNKESAKSASKTAWKHSKNFLVKTNDVVDKVMGPLIPIIAIADPETAAVLRLQKQLTAGIRAHNRQSQGQVKPIQAGQQRPNSMAVNPELLAQLSLLQQQQAPGMDNIGPLIALLQANTQAGSVTGQPSGGSPEAALLAALLQLQIQQIQMQQQQQQQQGQAQQQQQQQQQGQAQQQPQQQQGQVQQQSQPQQQPRPLQMKSKRKPVPSAATNAAMVPNAAPPAQTQPGTAQVPSGTAQKENAPGDPPLESVLSTLSLQPNTQTQGPQSQPQQYQQESPTAQPPVQQPSAQPLPPQTTTGNTAVQAPISGTSSWQHHRARVFGIQDMLLPPQNNLSAASRTVLTGDIAGGGGHFSIELLYNPTQLQRRVDALLQQQQQQQQQQQSLTESATDPSPDDPSAPLIARSDLNAGAVMAADCVIATATDSTASYVAVLQSPSQQGHGLCITTSATTANLPLAKAIGQSMVRSICWGDFALVCRDVSASVVGAWKCTAGAEGEDAAGGESVFDFNGAGCFAHGRPHGGVVVEGMGTESGTCEPKRTTGSFQVFEYENGVCHLVLTDDDPGQSADVRVLVQEEGSLVIEGVRYMRVAEPVGME